MNRFTRITALALTCGLAAAATAQSGGDYLLRKHVVAGGGGDSAGSPYLLRGTAGQHDAGPAPGGAMSGGDYVLRGGFWPEAVTPRGEAIFSDGFEGD
jgi:hypothetical protein